MIVGIMPTLLDSPAGLLGQIRCCSWAVFHAVFRDPGLFSGEVPVFTGEIDGLCCVTDQGHFNAACGALPASPVSEAARVDVALQIAVETDQQIAGEGGGDARRIVVGGFQQRRVSRLIQSQ